MPKPSSTLSVGILTRNSSERLASLLRYVSNFCDEIVVGIDEDSDQETYEVARRLADVVFRFEHTGLSGPARLLPFAFSSGDWHLVLDDDERMDERFTALLPELLTDTRYTHYYFPTKWIASTHPNTYFSGPPWFPDWHPRLIHNDLNLVWHSPKVHTEFQIQGLGCYEPRTALLHYERVFRTPQERQAKLERYRAHGMSSQVESYYLDDNKAPIRELDSSPNAEVVSFNRSLQNRIRCCRTIQEIQRVASRSPLPPWGAKMDVVMPEELHRGQSSYVEVTAINSGSLSWFPARFSSFLLTLSYHVKDRTGNTKIFDGERTLVGRIVAPGESGKFLALFKAPVELGNYLVEWDMVSEGECWFAECGSSTQIVPIRVV